MPARVMVVNDNQEILDSFRYLREEEGYEVVLAAFAPREIEEIERVKPDLVILDLMFGHEKLGWQLLQKMKMHRSTANIPVIVCSAATREVRDIEGYLRAHHVGLLGKPFDIEDFFSAVTQGLSAAMQGSYLSTTTAEKGPADELNGSSPQTAKRLKSSSGGDDAETNT